MSEVENEVQQPSLVALQIKVLSDQLRQNFRAEQEQFQVNGMPADENLPADDVAAITEWNTELAAVREAGANGIAPVLDTLANAAEQGLGALAVCAEMSRIDRANNLAKLSTLLSRGVQIALAASAALRPAVQAAEENRAKVLREVKAWLTAGGQGVEATIAGRTGHNPAAAEHQFNYLAEQNLRSVKASAELNAVKGAASLYAEISNQLQAGEPEVQKVLNRIVAKMIAA